MSTPSTGAAPKPGLVDRLKEPSERRLTDDRPGFKPDGVTGVGRGGSTGPDAPRAKSPLWNFEGIHKGSGWNAWSNMTVKHLRDESAALENAGLYLYRSIRRTKLWRFQIGKMVAAKRITRHLKRADALLLKASNEVVQARRQYAATFGGKAKTSPSDFDPEG